MTRSHPALCPGRWDAAALAETNRTIDAYVAEHGAFALQAAVTRGQYTHPDGVFYGGRRPTWSNATFRDILEKHVTGARRIAFIDLHTGLGAYGAAEMIGGAGPSTPNGRRMRDWYGGIVTSAVGRHLVLGAAGRRDRARGARGRRGRRRHQRDARIRHLPGARRAARALGGQLAPRPRGYRQRARPRNQGGYPQAAVSRTRTNGRNECWSKGVEILNRDPQGARRSVT